MKNNLDMQLIRAEAKQVDSFLGIFSVNQDLCENCGENPQQPGYAFCTDCLQREAKAELDGRGD